MTSLVSKADYRRITRDTASSDEDVQEQLDAAEELVAEYLKRPGRLQQGDYTDRLRLYAAEGLAGGYEGAYVVYPIATPVTAVPVGMTPLGTRSIAGASPDGGPFLDGIVGLGVEPYATVTYTGGWTSETLPETIRREIARLARAALSPASNIPAGATSVRLGDAAVTFADGTVAGSDLSPAAKRVLRRYMRRRAG